MSTFFRTVVELLKKSAETAANSPSRKGMYQEEMPEAVKKLKKHK